VIAAEPDRDSDVAVMVVVPAASDVTSPDELTDATVALDDDHDTERPERVFPAASRVVAESCVVCPTVSDAVAGETSTEETAAGGAGGGVVPPPSPPPPQPRSAQAARTDNRQAAGIRVVGMKESVRFMPE
jgi:hypothetical protein